MRKSIVIIGIGSLAIALTSCRTKELTIQKSKEIDLSELSRKFDSLIQRNLKHQLEHDHASSLNLQSLVLSSTPVYDSTGTRQPFHYKHIIDGVVKEEIFVSGGEINKESHDAKSESSETKNEVKKETTRIDVDVGQKQKKAKLTKGKAKTVKSSGFQFGVYVWVASMIIIILILLWIAKRFKLIDKIRVILGRKKEPPNN